MTLQMRPHGVSVVRGVGPFSSTSRRPVKPVRAKKERASPSAVALGSEVRGDLRSLGEALATRVGDVVEQTLARARKQGVVGAGA
jgi:hypothetical protein